ncbi:hypothetical protein BDV25DRAFT_172222 [Aspergillus avenaceus]|uniref:T6SS Phospholipase effector Tle1-like catalytic domain-containing protein n=1 Tax=Aspergillus avenaceus TaxID=36643 RepID=A0A5N6TVD1_ASPAV|nr:hypothetical protein BDV25DRAFT_172222 [Aspergillus avenaceus]
MDKDINRCDNDITPLSQASSSRKPKRELVLCFDGTNNSFRGDGSDSNILKIFRMLDRTKDDRYCYYQRITIDDDDDKSFTDLLSLPFGILDQAAAKSFGHHVKKGYKFLARRWTPGSKVYLFGFSRGAYTARYLNELLDFAGLISADNEETIGFVWDSFLQWKFADPGDKRKNAFARLELCRETMCRPIGLVHFLGLFDTVNSVSKFVRDVSKDNYVRPSPKIMRHAVSIDERRIKFQPVLFFPPPLEKNKNTTPRTSEWAMEAEIAMGGETIEGKAHNGHDAYEEVYFAGDHSDVGGGWPSDGTPTSQIPLMWMVQEAQYAGLTFVPMQLQKHNCFNPHTDHFDRFKEIMAEAEKAATHDSLNYKFGHALETLFWRIMEYLPYKRPKVAPDGTYRESRWHGRGLRRPLPPMARIHGSAVRRLNWDPNYKPYNLGMGNKQSEMTDWTYVGHSRRDMHGNELRDTGGGTQRMDTSV